MHSMIARERPPQEHEQLANSVLGKYLLALYKERALAGSGSP